MRSLIEKLPQDLLELVYLTRDAAEQQGENAYLVGGFVRDLLLGVKNYDLDFVIELDGIGVAEVLSQKLKAKLIRHRRFGTATLVIGHHHKIDISTARRESYPQPAALPHVAPGTLQDDLFRRDFTINALAIAVTGSAFGTLIDYYGGLHDMRDRNIRILHPASFIDDPTRILRGIRFEQRLDFTFEPETRKCLIEAVRQGMLLQVQPQRLRDDLILMFKEEHPLKEIRRMKDLTGVSFIDEGLSLPAESLGLFKSIEQHIVWFKREFSERRHIDTWLVYFMGLLEPLSVRRCEAVLKKFVFPRGVDKRIMVYKQEADTLRKALVRERIRVSRIFNLLEPLSYEVIILLLASLKDPRARERIDVFLRHHNGTKSSITGKDLLALGVEPGPHYQRILRAVLNARLDGKVKNREEEIAFARDLVSHHKR
jgi:tRNA nucleotidyltransferase (CCA-adding enzyme)